MGILKSYQRNQIQECVGYRDTQRRLGLIQETAPHSHFQLPINLSSAHPVYVSRYWQRTPVSQGPPRLWRALLTQLTEVSICCVHLDLVLPSASLPGWCHMLLLQLHSAPMAWLCWGGSGRSPAALASAFLQTFLLHPYQLPASASRLELSVAPWTLLQTIFPFESFYNHINVYI